VQAQAAAPRATRRHAHGCAAQAERQLLPQLQRWQLVVRVAGAGVHQARYDMRRPRTREGARRLHVRGRARQTARGRAPGGPRMDARAKVKNAVSAHAYVRATLHCQRKSWLQRTLARTHKAPADARVSESASSAVTRAAPSSQVCHSASRLVPVQAARGPSWRARATAAMQARASRERRAAVAVDNKENAPPAAAGSQRATGAPPAGAGGSAGALGWGMRVRSVGPLVATRSCAQPVV
jgi:hypothetical protein